METELTKLAHRNRLVSGLSTRIDSDPELEKLAWDWAKRKLRQAGNAIGSGWDSATRFGKGAWNWAKENPWQAAGNIGLAAVTPFLGPLAGAAWAGRSAQLARGAHLIHKAKKAKDAAKAAQLMNKGNKMRDAANKINYGYKAPVTVGGRNLGTTGKVLAAPYRTARGTAQWATSPSLGLPMALPKTNLGRAGWGLGAGLAGMGIKAQVDQNIDTIKNPSRLNPLHTDTITGQAANMLKMRADQGNAMGKAKPNLSLGVAPLKKPVVAPTPAKAAPRTPRSRVPAPAPATRGTVAPRRTIGIRGTVQQ